MLLPALQQARGKTKHARWLGIKRSIQLHPNCILYYTFEKDTVEDDKVKNQVFVGSKAFTNEAKTYEASKLDGIFGTVGSGLPTLVMDGGRFPGKAGLLFDRADDGYVEITAENAACFNFGTNVFSVSVWLMFAETDRSNAIVSKDYNIGGYDVGWAFCRERHTDDRQYMRARLANGSSFIHTNTDPTDDRPAVGTWYHIVFVRDGSNSKIYINGVDKTTSSNDLSTYDTDNDEALRIGNDNWYPFGGIIDEVAIFNKVLTENEIKQHYKMGRP